MKSFLINNIEIIRYIIFYIILFGIIFIGGKILYDKKRNVFEKIFKYRYLIGILILAICVVFEISGSSIGCWNNFLDGKEKNVILGKSRSIRSDEWAVNTPMAFSQKFNKTGKFKYFSDTIRGDKTDTFIVYGQPVYSPFMIYRIFQIGYLFLGISRGLSFFWCARFIFLLLVSFDMMMIITNKKRLLSLIGALLIGFSPIISWWFAINGLVEMLISGQLAIILLTKYLRTCDFKKRIIYLIGIAICAGTYLLTFYPAWQIPLIYVFAGLGIWTIIENWKQCKIEKRDIISIITIAVIFLLSIIAIFAKSWDTIKIVMNTTYPGKRCETGGGMINKFISYPLNMFLGIKDTGIDTNVCEMSTFFDLFPIGIMLALYTIFNNKKDNLLKIMLIIVTFLSVWCIYGFPEKVAKITLLSYSPAGRAFLAIGLLNIFILIRSVAILDKKINMKTSFIISMIISVLITLINIKVYPSYVGKKYAVVILITMFTMIYSILRYNQKICKYLLTIITIFVIILCGGIVNPIQKGIDDIYNQEIINKIYEINNEDSGLWIVEGSDFPKINIPIMVGAATINSTNVYPNLERWKSLDETGIYEEIYNRYAHISIRLTNEPTTYYLIQADYFNINLNVNDTKKLNVKYILTSNNLEDYNNSQIKFENIANNTIYKIYKVKYLGE